MALQLCLLEHFYFNPHAAFCDTREGLEEFVGDLQPADLEVLKNLPSFKRLQDTLKKDMPECDDGSLKESIIVAAEQLPLRMKEWVWSMKVLHHLKCALTDGNQQSAVLLSRRLPRFLPVIDFQWIEPMAHFIVFLNLDLF